jgi:acyl transferase domain-containing protein/acyl carrier protein
MSVRRKKVMLEELEVSVGLFPGQGAYLPGSLERLRADGAGEVIEAVDEVAANRLGRGLAGNVYGGATPSLDELFDTAPDLLQVAIFTASVAQFQILRAQGTRFSVLVGHSLGEIAALVAAGGLTVTEGAEILCHRIAVLREFDISGGGMLALSCDRDRVERILALLPSGDATVAVENGAAQTAISGPGDALRRVATIASAIGITATALRSPHAFHHDLLRPARAELAKRIGAYRLRPLGIPVFSPILGRYYRESDSIGDLLASHLVLPVRFGPTVERLYDAGARVWIEVGAGRTLTNLVRSAHPDVAVRTPLTGKPKAAARPEPVAVQPEPVVTQPVQPEPVVVQPEPVAVQPEPSSRTEIRDRVRALYAKVLEYPEEVFEDGAELEAELGIDSVKQTELIGQVGDMFELGARPAGLRTSDYRTFGSVVDFVSNSLTVAGAGR